MKDADPGGATLEIIDENGTRIRTLRGAAQKGLNRTTWNLRGEASPSVELRTTPDYHPHVWEEKRFNGRDTRPVSHWGIGGTSDGVLAVPGIYTVKLTVGGKSYEQKLEVIKDPNSIGTLEDIKAMNRLWTSVAQDTNEVVGIINRLEWVGKQMEDLAKVLARTQEGRPLQIALASAHGRMRDVEKLFLEDQLLASDPKSYREEMAIYQKLLWFAGEIGTGAGDIRNTEDFGPTSQQLEVYEIFKKRLADARAAFEKLRTETIPEFNKTLQQAGHGAIIVQ
jgi:hypothetical protein